jgi:hypothetical protein
LTECQQTLKLSLHYLTERYISMRGLCFCSHMFIILQWLSIWRINLLLIARKRIIFLVYLGSKCMFSELVFKLEESIKMLVTD